MRDSPRLPVAAAAALLVGILLLWRGADRPPTGAAPAREAASPHEGGAIASPPSGFDRASFGAWLASYVAAERRQRETMVARGAELLAGRRAWMADLIQRDPERALEEAIVPADRAVLPDRLIELLETPLSSMGSFEVEIACGFADGRGEVRRFVELDGGRRLPAFTFGRRLDVPCKDRIAIQGIEAGGVVAVDAKPLRELSDFERDGDGGGSRGGVLAEAGGRVLRFDDRAEFDRTVAALEREELALGPAPRGAYLALEGEGGGGGIAAESAWTEGDKTVLYLRVQFSDDEPGRQDLSDEDARSRQDDVEEFMRLNSYGKSRWATTIPDTIWLENTFSHYQGVGWSTMLNDARALAITMGQAQGEDWDYNNYDFYTVVSRGGIGGYAGIAQVGGRRSHLQDSRLRTAGHEFGHNIGLPHANYHYSKALDPRGGETYEGLSNVEYGHRFSIQSAQSGGDFNNPSRPHFTVHEKWRLDWLTDADMLDVTGASTNGVHRLFQNDHVDATGLRALRLPSGGAMSKYWVSYRTAWPANPYLSNGAVFDWTGSGGGRSTLLDMTPYSDDGSHSGADWTRDNRDKWDAALAIGRTYSDRESGVHVTPLARGGSAPAEYLDLYVHVEGGDPVTLLGEAAPCRATVPDASTPSDWMASGFDDSGWASGNLGVGYERGSGYGGYLGIDLEPAMYNVNESAYIRAAFEIADPSELALRSLELQVRCDDGFVAYLNGVQVASFLAPPAPAWDSGAIENHPDSSAETFVAFDVSAAIGGLVVGTNVLAIHGLNSGLTSSDFLIQPRLVGVPDAPPNSAPVVDLAASRSSVAAGGTIDFTATGSDPDGDELSYAWHFDEGDAYVAEGQNSPAASKSWTSAGKYLVRVTCSDRKGGLAEDTLVVTVGSPVDDREIHGRVLRGGEPLGGARITGGGKATTSAPDGSYSLVGLDAGPHRLEAEVDGATLLVPPPGPVAPDPVEWGVDFWAMGRGAAARALSVSPHRAVVELGETLPLSAFVWDNAAPADGALVPFGASWRYLDDGSDQGDAWRDPSFDDAGWAEGAAQLGFGEGDEATVISFGGDPDNVHTTTYFRHAFTVADAAGISRARLRLVRDDGVVVFLNGAELLRENMTSGTVSAGTESRNEISGSAEGEVLEFAVDPALLTEGANTLAVEIHQEDSDSQDLSFDLELVAARNLAEVAPTWTLPAGATVDGSGAFVATSPGAYEVQAEFDGLAGTALITVPTDLQITVGPLVGIVSEYGAGAAAVRVTRTDPGGELAVGLAVSGDATAGADFTALPASVTFADGVSGIDVVVQVLDDAEVEGREAVEIGVAPSAAYVIGDPASATVWIEDDDLGAPPLVSIAAPPAAVVREPVSLDATAVALEALVARESAWRYLDDGSDQGAAWRAPEFDDSSWGLGFGSLGYGDGDEATVVSNGGDPQAITTYFRKRFGAGELSGATGLRLELQRDDGAIVYLNGGEVWRANMPQGPVGYQTTAGSTVGGGSEDTYFVETTPGLLPLVGDNLLAVEIHQTSATSSDISFDLAASLTKGEPALFWERVSGAGEVRFSDETAADPEVRFDQPGSYVLRLTATDGGLQSSAEVSLDVAPRDYAWWLAGYPSLADGDPAADPEGDGFPNLFEFAFGGDPGSHDRPGLGPTATPAADGTITVSYRRLAGGAGSAGDGYQIDGIRYVVEVATDLEFWSPAAQRFALEEVAPPSDSGDGTETVSLRLRTDLAEPASDRWFVRVTVSESP